MDFTGKTAISTGAASGMGLLFAENFAELGGNVVMCDVNEKVLDEKVREINGKGNGKAPGKLTHRDDVIQKAQIVQQKTKFLSAYEKSCKMAHSMKWRRFYGAYHPNSYCPSSRRPCQADD